MSLLLLTKIIWQKRPDSDPGQHSWFVQYTTFTNLSINQTKSSKYSNQWSTSLYPCFDHQLCRRGTPSCWRAWWGSCRSGRRTRGASRPSRAGTQGGSWVGSVMMLTKMLSKNFKPGRGALLQRPPRVGLLAPPVQATDGAGSSWNKIGNAQLWGNQLREWKRWQ